jgi:hypothetical protein
LRTRSLEIIPAVAVDPLLRGKKECNGLPAKSPCLGVEPSSRAIIALSPLGMTGACTNRYTSRDVGSREEVMLGPLCPGCFAFLSVFIFILLPNLASSALEHFHSENSREFEKPFSIARPRLDSETVIHILSLENEYDEGCLGKKHATGIVSSHCVLIQRLCFRDILPQDLGVSFKVFLT